MGDPQDPRKPGPYSSQILGQRDPKTSHRSQLMLSSSVESMHYTERQARPADAFVRSRILLSMILDDTDRRSLISNLKGEDAQCTIDYLDKILRERNGILATEEGMSVLSLLYALAHSARLFPQCYILKEIPENDFELIISGAISDIFRGQYDGQPICLKASRPLSSNRLPSIAKEFVMWAHLSHQNILPLYGVCFLGISGRFCLVSPWIQYNNVVEYLTEFPESHGMALVSDVASGLLYLHQLMIVHGNLIPSNILVSDDGRAMIAGFALSSITAGDRGVNGLVEGGGDWIAPELLNDEEEIVSPQTQVSDIWSFGHLCYEILTHSGPFIQYPASMKVASPILTHQTTSQESEKLAVGSIWNLINKCWDRDPRNRPSCEDIWRFIMDLGIRDTRPPISSNSASGLAVWEAMRATWDSKIDYQRVYNILFRTSGIVS